jgi:hypothetical protein
MTQLMKSPDNLPAPLLHDFARRGLRKNVGGVAERPDPSIRDARFFRCSYGIFVFQPAGIEAAQDFKPSQEIQFE